MIDQTTRRAALATAAALALTVVTQLAYIVLDAGGKQELGYPIWRTEAVLGLVVISGAFMLLPRWPLLGGTIAASGVINLLQVGLGLTMFYNLGYGTEAGPEPTFFAVVGFAFFLYFAAKALLAIAALVLGATLWREARGLWRIVGVLTALAGLASLAANLAAMTSDFELTFPAGAAGTLATALLALALTRVPAAKTAGQV